MTDREGLMADLRRVAVASEQVVVVLRPKDALALASDLAWCALSTDRAYGGEVFGARKDVPAVGGGDGG